MGIGPTGVNDMSLEGMAPFFRYFIHPSYSDTDLTAENWYERLLDRFLVEVMYEGEDEYVPMPVYEINDFYSTRSLPEWCNSALQYISHIKVLFPIQTTED